MPPNQPPLNFPPPPKRVDFLGPLLQAAQLKFKQQQIEATKLFRKEQLELQQQDIDIQNKRLEIARTKAEREPLPTKASLAAAARPGDPAAALDLLDDDTPTKVITRFVKGKVTEIFLLIVKPGQILLI